MLIRIFVLPKVLFTYIMAQKKILLLLFLYLEVLSADAQQKFWVFFTDKHNTIISHSDFSPQSIIRRQKAGIAFDSTDFDVNSNYILKIAQYVDSIGYTSRWLNAVSVYGDQNSMLKIKSLPFVKSITEMHSIARTSAFDTIITSFQWRKIKTQHSQMEANLFGQKKIDGRGIIIAVLDNGFEGVDKSPVFKHLFQKNRILATYDFTKKRELVYADGNHGTMVLSCLAGMARNRALGFAPGAEYLLARTEVKQEIKAEEDYWIAAMEWADQRGAHIINSSLGYTYQRYFTDQMDGQTSLLSRAANMAAAKGMLVVNAMGNDGDNDWKIMGVPADADSVLSVGAIDPGSYIHAAYSSYGPTWDKRLKPNVCAFGNALVATDEQFEEAKGTSFATPFISGFAACVWQLNPDMNNMQIKYAIETSAHLFPYYDYAHGYGVPQASYFLNDTLLNKPSVSFEIHTDDDSIYVDVMPEYISLKKKEFNHLYFHIQNTDNFLEEYAVIEVEQSRALSIHKQKLKHGYILRIFYKGYLVEYKN